MRNIFFFIVLFSLGFQSCKDKTDPVLPKADNFSGDIIGEWTINTINQHYGEYSQNGEITGTFTSEGSNIDGFYTFSDDGKIEAKTSYTNTITTKNILGEENIITSKVSAPTYYGVYSFNRTAKYVMFRDSIQGENFTYTIAKITDNELIIEAPVIQQLNEITISSTLRIGFIR
jgi:hypothetical protein